MKVWTSIDFSLGLYIIKYSLVWFWKSCKNFNITTRITLFFLLIKIQLMEEKIQANKNTIIFNMAVNSNCWTKLLVAVRKEFWWTMPRYGQMAYQFGTYVKNDVKFSRKFYKCHWRTKLCVEDFLQQRSFWLNYFPYFLI